MRAANIPAQLLSATCVHCVFSSDGVTVVKVRVLSGAEQQVGNDCWVTCCLNEPGSSHHLIAVPLTTKTEKHVNEHRSIWNSAVLNILYICVRPARGREEKRWREQIRRKDVMNMLISTLHHLVTFSNFSRRL